MISLRQCRLQNLGETFEIVSRDMSLTNDNIISFHKGEINAHT